MVAQIGAHYTEACLYTHNNLKYHLASYYLAIYPSIHLYIYIFFFLVGNNFYPFFFYLYMELNLEPPFSQFQLLAN